MDELRQKGINRLLENDLKELNPLAENIQIAACMTTLCKTEGSVTLDETAKRGLGQIFEIIKTNDLKALED